MRRRNQDCSQPAGAAADEFAHASENVAEAVGHGLADGENDFKDTDDDDEKEQRPQTRWSRMLSILRCLRRRAGLGSQFCG